MPKKKKLQEAESRSFRNTMIREYVQFRLNEDDIRYDIAVNEVMTFWGLSESTIYQIVKKGGVYAEDDVPIDKKFVRKFAQTLKRIADSIE